MKPMLIAMVALAMTVSACTSSYQPRPGPRLSIAMRDGKMEYQRDGQHFNFGFLGGGLVEAVSPNPRAHAAARTYRDKSIRGFVLTLVGSACATGTAMYMMLKELEDEEYSPSRTLVVTTLACTAGFIWGGVELASAQPYHWDAINIYNDDVEARGIQPGTMPYAPVPAPPPYTPPGAYGPWGAPR